MKISAKKSCWPLVFAALAAWDHAQAARLDGPVAAGREWVERNHPFAASSENLSARGYVEEEYFLSGQARIYNLPNLATAGVIVSGQPYRTRVLVRRPIEPKKFNGTVVVEWLNVTRGFDSDPAWVSSHDHFMREGYAWVGVSAQQVGVHGEQGLKNWSPQRYGSLGVEIKGPMAEDALSYDIFADAGEVLRKPEGADALRGQRPKVLIASATSQSARRLAYFLNGVHPLRPVYDAAVLDGAMGDRIREDLSIRIGKFLTESDLIGGGEARVRRPDGPNYVSWEIAGASHVSRQSVDYNAARLLRDVGPEAKGREDLCVLPPYSDVPKHLALSAFYDHVARWVRDGRQPPSFAPIAVRVDDQGIEILRGENGIALGGLRLAEVDVPRTTNTGAINRGRSPKDDRACRMVGTSQQWSREQFLAAYGSGDNYLDRFASALEASRRSGAITVEGAAESLEAAKAAIRKWNEEGLPTHPHRENGS